MEVLTSHILECFTNIDHVEYTGRMRNTQFGKIYVDKCKNFVNEDYSFVEAREVMEYCKFNNINYFNWALNNFGSQFANIGVIDYIIMNTDRHDNNYGFMMDNKTGKLRCVAPLFDYNLALVSDVFGINSENTLSQMFNTKETILDIAIKLLPYSSIEIDKHRLDYNKHYFKDYQYVYCNITKRITKIFN
jgi:hypothetical protein